MSNITRVVESSFVESHRAVGRRKTTVAAEVRRAVGRRKSNVAAEVNHLLSFVNLSPVRDQVKF